MFVIREGLYGHPVDRHIIEYRYQNLSLFIYLFFFLLRIHSAPLK